MISPVTGKLIHHNNCTYCAHRKVYKGAVNKRNELEVCALLETFTALPHPRAGGRFCEHYQQIGCDCNQCVPDGTST